MSDNSLLNRSDEIDLKAFFLFLLRNKKNIFLFVFFGIFISYLLSFLQKNLWKGELQIVLENSKNSSSILNSITANTSIPFLIGDRSLNQLNTEKEILKSPYVLMPIFEFVKSQDEQKSKQDFSSWREKSLEVKFLKGTSILQLSYFDQNKELILPVLRKISSTYQNYPDRTRINGLKNGIEYLNTQIDLYKEKSDQSIIKLQEFSNMHDIPFLLNGSTDNSDKKDSLNLEAVRISSTNKIREIDQKLIELEKIYNNKELQQFIGILKSSDLISNNNISALQNELDNLESKIINAKSRLKDSDPYILELKNRKNFLVKDIKQNTIGSLKMRKINAELLKKSVSRPKEVTNKYRLLLIEANRDQLILSKLINKKSDLSLSIAKDEKPWQLISDPKLYNNPVGPNKLKYIIFGFTLSSLLGILSAYIIENKKGLLFDSNRIKENNIKKRIIIKTNSEKIIFNQIKLYLLTISDLENTSLGILSLSNDNKLNNNFKKALNSLNIDNYKISKNINEIIKFSCKILLVKIKETNFIQIQKSIDDLSLFSSNIDGIIIYEEE